LIKQNQNNLKMQQEEKSTSKETTPQEDKQIEAYSSGLLNLLYTKETGGGIYEILKGAPPEKSIPQAALLVNGEMEKATKAKGKPPSLTVLLNSGLILVNELATIGHAGGFFQLTQDQMPTIMESSMQLYIEKGLADGSIDPIELQEIAETHMTPEMKEEGLAAAEATGVSHQAGVGQAMEMHANSKVKQATDKMANEISAKERRGMMQQAQAQGGQQ
jgi:hypothetical protein